MYLIDNELRLRPIIMPDDIENALPWYQDPEVLYYSEGGDSSTPYNYKKIEAMYNYLLNMAEVYIIEVNSGDRWLPIGDVSLFQESGVPIVIGNPEYRSKGIGKRVIQLIINRARELGRKNITTNGVYIFNERSRRMFEGLGFQLIEKFIDDDGNECYRFRYSMATVRKANENDITKVTKLSELWVSECITHGLGPSTEEFLQNYIGDYFWVAEMNSEIVGYITGSVHENDGLAVIEKGELFLEIDEVYVHPEFRTENIGHMLVERLLNIAESNGIVRSVVYSASKQWQRIVGFYEKHGFKMWFVQMYR